MKREMPPSFVFWVAGVPRSLQATRKADYTESIRQAAKQSIGKPLKTPRIDIDIVFACKDRNLRADVDNVAKPVLDALKDVLYDDDRQVRSVRVVALPLDDVFKASGPVTAETWKRLLECEEFLVVARVNSELHLEFF
jgi:hypothetical protein